MKQVLFRSVAAFFLLVTTSVFVFGQVTTAGSIACTVTDPSGATVAGANVTPSTKSDSNPNFR